MLSISNDQHYTSDQVFEYLVYDKVSKLQSIFQKVVLTEKHIYGLHAMFYYILDYFILLNKTNFKNEKITIAL